MCLKDEKIMQNAVWVLILQYQINYIKDGLENFTFELLEKCTNTELNSKEKFYIELYQADKYGYNSKAGNNT